MNIDVGSASPSSPHLVCAACEGRKDGFQIYTVRLSNRRLVAWDVEQAWKLCSDGRTPIRIHPALVDEMLRVNQYNPAHLEHVDPTQPGITCALEYIDDSAPVLALIDGTHRAAVCRRDDRSFFAYLLNEEESILCQRTLKVALFHALRAQEE